MGMSRVCRVPNALRLAEIGSLSRSTHKSTGRRCLFGLSRKKTLDPEEDINPILKASLWHGWSQSPVKQIRDRADFIKKHAKCHVAGTSVDFECPDCGIPVYSSKKAWEKDHDNHLQVCQKLRELNEDEHDLRSGRRMMEFILPQEQQVDHALNFSSWDTLLYTRSFTAINSLRSIRHVSNLLTYPMTIASTLHQSSPYRLNHRLTVEGLKSLAALRYTLHPPATDQSDVRHLKEIYPVRVFILGARAESSLPTYVWQQLCYMFPGIVFRIYFIGPQAMYGKEASSPRSSDGCMHREHLSSKISFHTYPEPFHVLDAANTFTPYDPYFDVFFMFSPGLGYHGASEEWKPSLPALLESKCAIFSTGFSQEDMQRDVDWLSAECKGEYDLLLEPGENPFQSTKHQMSNYDPSDVIQANWGVFGFRGKRYEAINLEDEEEET